MRHLHVFAGFVVLVLATLVVTRAVSNEDEDTSAFIADPVDCIAGVDVPRRLSNPARIDHPAVLEKTPPLRELRRRRIAPDSAEGIILRAQGETLVAEACTAVMNKLGHDSIWKRITRRDGVPVPDVTRDVLARIVPDPTEIGAQADAPQR